MAINPSQERAYSIDIQKKKKKNRNNTPVKRQISQCR